MTFKMNETLGSRLSSGGSSQGVRRAFVAGATYQPSYEKDDRRTMRWAIGITLFFHALLFFVTFPQMHAEPREVKMGRKAYVVEQVRFEPPKPRAERKSPPEKKAKRIPVPDPTPDDPEPIRELEMEIEVPETEVEDVGKFFDLPEGPDVGGPGGPIHVSGNVTPPEKIFAPQPRYTEEARKARVQGVVILQAIIDHQGNVTKVKVLKGLPEGLDQSAVDTVKEWKFKPATLEGEPVPVYFNLTVSFSLQ